MRQFLSYLKPYRMEVIMALLFITVDVLAEIIQPRLMANIVGKGIQSGDLRYILTTGGVMVAFSLVCIVAGVCNSRFSAKAGVGFGANLRKALFSKVQTFSFKNIDSFSTASLSTRLTNDVTLMQNMTVMGMRLVVRAPLMLIFAILMAVRLNLKMSEVLAVVTPVLLIVLALLITKAMPLFQNMQGRIDRVNGNVQENLTNVRVVKSFVREDYEKEKFKGSNDALMNASMKAMGLMILAMPVMMLMMNITIVAVVYIGGGLIIQGEMDVAALTAFINYIFMILMSLMMISMLFIMLSRASASYKRIMEVLRTEVDLTDPELTDGKTAVRLPAGAERLSGQVEFRNVDFKYNEESEEYILKEINFKASPGQVVAIIGGTGAGKSSLVQLIPRLYDVSGGQVLLDGRDVREYGLHTLRDNVGMVLQKNTLFSGTIRENLKWGNPDASDEEIVEAAKNAQAHDFIMSFPEGYDTWIEQGGVNVSGGQKQRLCIARAMLKKPSVLILDDSTSAVDTATEKRIWEAFGTALKDTTTILIAQRISSVQDADEIIVLDDGMIVGLGTHEELLKTCEAYQEIYESQIGKEGAE